MPSTAKAGPYVAGLLRYTENDVAGLLSAMFVPLKLTAETS